MNYTYTVVDTTSSLTTPFCTYDNLMRMHHRIYFGMDSLTLQYFYKKGIGFVGMLDEQGILTSFLTPDTTIIVKPARKSFCNMDDWDSSIGCTYRFMYNAVTDQLINSKVFEKESMAAEDLSVGTVFLLSFDITGNLSEVIPLQQNKAMKKSEKLIIKTLHDASECLPAEDEYGDKQRFFMLMNMAYE